MSETATVRVRALRGFRIAIGQDAKAGEVLDLPRGLYQLMKSANAVEEVPVEELPAAVAPSVNESDKPAKAVESKTKEK